MRIFIAGVSCVGKTTIGAKLADLLDYQFFDLDLEVEKFYGMPIERLQNRYPKRSSFRAVAAQVLTHLLAREGNANLVIALPPRGLMDPYWKVIKNVAKSSIVLLQDRPENILTRITFYDIDSHQINKVLTDRERNLYLRDIKNEITYFRRSHQKANIAVEIAGLSPDDASHKIKDLLLRDR